MKTNRKVFLIIIIMSSLIFISGVSLFSKVIKVKTGYWVINLFPSFNTKATMVSFNHPNSGTKKILKGKQIVGIQVAIWNKGAKQIKVRRNDFSLNGQSLNFFAVKEKKTQQLVVKVAPGKALGITNYYILNSNVKTLSDLKLIYSGVTKQYKKKRKIIPLLAKTMTKKSVPVNKGKKTGIIGKWGLDESKSKNAGDGNTAGLMKTVFINSDGTFKALYGTEGTWKIKGSKILISYKNRYQKNLQAYISGQYLKFPAPAARKKFCYLKRK